MKLRSRKHLLKMHVWTHRRLHNSSSEHFRYWLDIRTKIESLIREA